MTYTIYQTTIHKGAADRYAGEITTSAGVTHALDAFAQKIGCDEWSLDQTPGKVWLCPAHSILFLPSGASPKSFTS